MIANMRSMKTGGLGQFVRKHRDELGITQSQLAAAAGVRQSSVSDLERGKVALPDAGVRRALAKALGVEHLEMLVAAEELLEEELPSQNADHIVLSNDEMNVVLSMRTARVTPERVNQLTTTISGWIEWDAKVRKGDEHR